MADDPFVTRVRKFIRAGGTRCGFAESIEKNDADRIAWTTVRGELRTDVLTRAIDDAEDEGHAFGFVLPDLRSPLELVAILARLVAEPRWAVTLPAWRVEPGFPPPAG